MAPVTGVGALDGSSGFMNRSFTIVATPKSFVGELVKELAGARPG